MELVGFSETSIANPSSGPVTVRLDSAQAAVVRKVLDSLPLGPPMSCMENSLLYRIEFRPDLGSAVSFVADGYGCVAGVTVQVHGKTMSPLYEKHCSLLHEVIGLLPAHKANGTRYSVAGCSQ